MIQADAKASTRLAKILAILNLALEAHSILNPDFKEAKAQLNWLCDGLFFCNGIYYNDLWFTSSSHANNRIKAAEKQMKKECGDTGTCPPMIRFIAAAKEVKVLHDALESLKSVVVKRQIRSEEERADDYVPPMPTTAAAKLVNGILKEMTDGLTADYANYLHNSFVTDVQRYRPRPRAERLADESVPTFLESVLMPLIGDKWDSFNGCYTTLKSNYSYILFQKARADAEFAQRMFLYKNVTKLAAIIEAKGNFASHKILDGQINSAGFQGEIVFEFADGSKFNVRNKVILKYSIYNRPFHQFPTTFHYAVLPNGKTMEGQPSEEEMNEIFAVA